LADQVQRQRAYYSTHAAAYDAGWSKEWSTVHMMLPFALLAGVIDVLGVTSLLDVGSGSGHCLRILQRMRPNLKVIGVEPSAEMREAGYQSGLSPDVLVDGDATALGYADGEFDLVCEFGMLHHLPQPSKAVDEICRVASKAVFLNDSNNFGGGDWKKRVLKQGINALGLWKWADLVNTRGKGYRESEGDGISYSYSVFNDVPLLEKRCRSVHALNLGRSARRPYQTSDSFAVVGLITDEVVAFLRQL
jgi:SAM-dependent methyltransferase